MMALDHGAMHVVSGVLPSPGMDGILMGLRPRTSLRPLMWEFPGGKVEASDPDVRSALAREWREELSIVVAVGERIATTTVHADVLVLVELFEVSVVRHMSDAWPPRSVAHEETRWVAPDEAVRNLGCSPAFYGHYPFLSLWWREKVRRSRSWRD